MKEQKTAGAVRSRLLRLVLFEQVELVSEGVGKGVLVSELFVSTGSSGGNPLKSGKLLVLGVDWHSSPKIHIKFKNFQKINSNTPIFVLFFGDFSIKFESLEKSEE